MAQTKEQWATYMREWRKRNPQSEYRSRRNYKQGHRKQVLSADERSWNRHPEKRKARHAVANALRDGRLLRPSCCSKCSVACIPEAHHADYSKPLEVTWLCSGCHLSETGKVLRITNGLRPHHVPHDSPSRKKNSLNTSGFKGVDWNDGQWRVRIAIKNQRFYLGHFMDKDQAAKVYDEAARKYHGPLAKVNFSIPDGNEEQKNV